MVLAVALAALGCSEGKAQSQAAPAAVREDWPTFLGPDHTGVSKETGLLKSWPEKGPPELWRMDLGETYAMPSVAGGVLVVFHRSGAEEVIEGVDPSTGARKWRYAYETRYRDRYGYCGGPRAQPTIADGNVYTMGAEGKMHCVELASGKLVWSRPLQEEYFKERHQNFFGVGVAPRLVGDAILVNLGDEREGCVTAIDRKTGKTLWRAAEDGASYSTAIGATVGKSRQAIFLTREGGLGVGLDDGKVRWSYPFRSRERESANAASPVVIGDKLLLTAAYGVGSALLQLEEGGVKEVWRNKSLSSHWATPIYVDGHVYGFDGRHEHEAELRCVRLSDGMVLWSKKGYERGSMTLAEGKFYILAEDGRLVLAELSPAGAKEISSAQVLASHCWAAPVLARGLLYVQNFDHATGKAKLLCLDVRSK
jgi:outer membrane protein assembly factor BamB